MYLYTFLAVAANRAALSERACLSFLHSKTISNSLTFHISTLAAVQIEKLYHPFPAVLTTYSAISGCNNASNLYILSLQVCLSKRACPSRLELVVVHQ